MPFLPCTFGCIVYICLETGFCNLRTFVFVCSIDLYLRESVSEIDGPPDPLDFYRDFVSANVPVIFRNAAQNFVAVQKWTQQFLRYGRNWLKLLLSSQKNFHFILNKFKIIIILCLFLTTWKDLFNLVVARFLMIVRK